MLNRALCLAALYCRLHLKLECQPLRVEALCFIFSFQQAL